MSHVRPSDLDTIFEGSVRGISGEGHGVIESPSKKIYFVAGAWPGDRVRVKVTESTSRYGYGRLLEILEPSPDRVNPVCEHQGWGEGKCGGCPWMIGSYESQIRHKEHRLRHLLERANVLDSETKFSAVRPSPKNLGYRNRAQLKSDGKKIGFMAVGSREIVDIRTCPILSDKNAETLAAMRSTLPNASWIPQQKGHEFVKLEINEEIGASQVRPNERILFQQANDLQNAFMKEWIESYLERWTREGRMGKVGLELFCGSGNFTRVLLPRYSETDKSLFAVEWKGAALERLQREKLSHLKIFEADLFRPGVWRSLKEWIETQGVSVKDLPFLFLDPPRDGLKNRQGLLAEFNAIDSVLYVSCDLATLARDLQYFKDKGFKVLEVQGVDQFPHTSHLEVLCALAR